MPVTYRIADMIFRVTLYLLGASGVVAIIGTLLLLGVIVPDFG